MLRKLLFSLFLFNITITAQWNNGKSAVKILGQSGFDERMAATSISGFTTPQAIVFDTLTKKLYVGDRLNNRVLRFSSEEAMKNGGKAEAVFGQPNFTSAGSGTSLSSFNSPIGLAVDTAGRLWVGDYGNNRVLRFDNAAEDDSVGAEADAVLGQVDFTSNTSGTSQNTMYGPVDLFVDHENILWVTDHQNNRVLKFENPAQKENGANADGVLGQQNFDTRTSEASQSGMGGPNGVYVDANGSVWVCEYTNSRVVKFDSASVKPNGANANLVLGQADFDSKITTTSQIGMKNCRFVYGDNEGRIFVGEELNNRVLVFVDATNLANGAPANYVLGQPDFTTDEILEPPARNSMRAPRGMAFDYSNQIAWITDAGNNRVLMFDYSDSSNYPFLQLNYPNGGEEFVEDDNIQILWESENVSKIDIEFSSDNGNSWINIAENVNATSGTYSWTVTDAISEECIIRIADTEDETITDKSQNTFSIISVQPSVKLLSPNGGEYWTTGSFPKIFWESKNIVLLKIELSVDNGTSWESIIPYTIAANKSDNTWQIPDIESEECLIRISKLDDDTIYDISEETFTITTDSVQTKIVVIGSSTAYGTGASTVDSSWVGRYRNYITGRNTNTQVINLAVGGYTTYDLMPTGFVPPAGRPTPKTAANITRAVSYNPQAIIVNLPSNDATQGFPVEEQISNYEVMLEKAYEKDIPVWVGTTQPRNLTEDKRQIQMDMRDSTYSIFGEYALDFWTDLANEDGTLNNYYNSGDGVHLNDAGHRVLFERVVDAQIYETTIIPVSVDEPFILSNEFLLEQNYPNPFNPSTNIQFSLAKTSKVSLRIYNILGQLVETLVNEELSAGVHKFKWNANNISAGAYFYTLSTSEYHETKKMMLVK